MNWRGIFYSLSISLLSASIVITSLVYPSLSFAQGERNCGNSDFEVGINPNGTSISREGSKIKFSITTKSGSNCVTSKNLNRSGLTNNDFKTAPGYGKSNSYAIFNLGSVKTVFNSLEYAARYYIVIGEDAEATGDANFKGIYLQSAEISGQKIDKRLMTLEEFSGLDEKHTSYSSFKLRYDAFWEIAGKKVSNAVQKKVVYELSMDSDINYSGSEVGSVSPPFEDSGQQWTGEQKKLPRISNSEVEFQFWHRPTGETGDGKYIFYKTVKINLTNNPSDGKYKIKTELIEGDYAVTSFLQITNDGAFSGFTAQMLVGSDSSSLEGENLFGALSDAEDNVFSRTYLGLIDRGRADLFILRNDFSVSEISSSSSQNASYKWEGSTRDVYGEAFGDCSLTNIINPIKGNRDIGSVFSAMNICFYQHVIDPIIKWAVQLITDTAGIAFYLPKHYFLT